MNAQCNNPIDRSGFCCGTEAHSACDCSAPAECLSCKAVGKSANHKVGSPACKTQSKKSIRGHPGATPGTQRPTNVFNTSQEAPNGKREKSTGEFPTHPFLTGFFLPL
jgi:hypothetical protein